MPRKWTNAEVKHKRKPEKQLKQPRQTAPKSYAMEAMKPCPECAELLPHNLVERIADPELPEYKCPNPKRVPEKLKEMTA